MQILLWIIIGAVALLSILCCVYLTLATPIIIVWKFYRKFHYGMSLYD